jgi:hypothetical protein
MGSKSSPTQRWRYLSSIAGANNYLPDVLCVADSHAVLVDRRTSLQQEESILLRHVSIVQQVLGSADDAKVHKKEKKPVTSRK